MPHISKNVWCQAHYTQQHHQEEREGIFWGLFFVFSVYIYSWKQPLKIPIKTSHTERQLFLCSWRWWEYKFLRSWKSGQTLGFTKEKGENRGLLPWTHTASDRYISLGHKGGNIGRFQHVQDKDYFACSSQGFIRYYGKQRSAVAKPAVGFGYQKPLQIQPCLVGPLQL